MGQVWRIDALRMDPLDPFEQFEILYELVFPKRLDAGNLNKIDVLER
ncbi:MAG: hypothetical protein R2744_08715 [Bacteroidales bacterium]